MTRSTSSKGTPATNFIENCFGVFKKHDSPLKGSSKCWKWLRALGKTIGSKPPEIHSRCLYRLISTKMSTRESASITFIGVRLAIEKMPNSLNLFEVLSILTFYTNLLIVAQFSQDY